MQVPARVLSKPDHDIEAMQRTIESTDRVIYCTPPASMLPGDPPGGLRLRPLEATGEPGSATGGCGCARPQPPKAVTYSIVPYAPPLELLTTLQLGNVRKGDAATGRGRLAVSLADVPPRRKFPRRGVQTFCLHLRPVRSGAVPALESRSSIAVRTSQPSLAV